MLTIPTNFSLLTGDGLFGVLKDNPELREPLTKHMNATFASYRRQVREATTAEEFRTHTEYLAASVKQAYHFHVVSLNKLDLMAVLDRTVLSLYISGESLYGYLYLVPETVKAINYHHLLFADKLH